MTPIQEAVPAVTDWTQASDAEVLRGYEEMAADEEREREAMQWIESHVGECL